MQNKLIINTEFFLECHGSCSGCFLTIQERKEKQSYELNIMNGLKKITEQYKNTLIDHLIVGIGRGNILSISDNQIKRLADIVNYCENNFNYNKITFEISTSLIGKIKNQISIAHEILSISKNIYFNIIVNSDIVSNNFWQNLNEFYLSMAKERMSWGMSEDWGDIVVLNVNPNKLPEIKFIKNFVNNRKSPINISIFPYEKEINGSDLKELNEWSNDLWEILEAKDFNIKNYLEEFYKFDLPYNVQNILEYNKKSEGSYLFIDKTGHISNGIPSIMGEVDYIRLVKKYNIEADILSAYKKMQKNNICSKCDVQKECLMSGAYLNFIANKDKHLNNELCLSGYQNIFIKAKQKYS